MESYIQILPSLLVYPNPSPMCDRHLSFRLLKAEEK